MSILGATDVMNHGEKYGSRRAAVRSFMKGLFHGEPGETVPKRAGTVSEMVPGEPMSVPLPTPSLYEIRQRVEHEKGTYSDSNGMSGSASTSTSAEEDDVVNNALLSAGGDSLGGIHGLGFYRPSSARTGSTGSWTSSWGSSCATSTPSFGSTVTDFDGMLCPGAQAEHNAEYVSKVFGFGRPLPHPTAALNGMPPGLTAVGPPMGYPAMQIIQPPFPHHGLPSTDPDSLCDAAAQLEAAAAKLRSQATMLEKQQAAKVQASAKIPLKAACVQSSAEPAGRTTLMLRNIPNDYTRDMLLDLLNDEGFQGKVDFLYLPLDLKRMVGLGYAFLNMVEPQDAADVFARLDGFTGWNNQSKKVCSVTWGEPMQGLQENIEFYRNSPVMHEVICDAAKPVLYSQGMRVPFPTPTRKLKAPRVKK